MDIFNFFVNIYAEPSNWGPLECLVYKIISTSTVCLATGRPSNKLVDVINRQKDKVKNFNDKLLTLQSSRSHDITQGHSTRLDNISEPSTNEMDAPSTGLDASTVHNSRLDIILDHSTRLDDITSGHTIRVENISEPSTNEIDAPSAGMDASSDHSSG